MSRRKQNAAALKSQEMVREFFEDGVYEYYPLGEYVVAARGMCGGRPTIKYRRLDARHIMGFLKRGDTPEEVAENYRIPLEAVHEVVRLSKVYDYERSYA
jgi:uncharacterized protein (DUF433 family)